MSELFVRAKEAAEAAAGGTSGAKEGGGSNNQAAQAAKAAQKAASRAHMALGFNICWWIFAGVCGVLAALQVYSICKAYFIRRRIGPRRAQGIVSTDSRPRSISALGRALHAVSTNYAYVKVFPAWIYSNSTAAEWFWTAAYTGIVLGMTAWVANYQGKNDFANPMGYAVSLNSISRVLMPPPPNYRNPYQPHVIIMLTQTQAFAQLPLIVGLASKNNLISYFTGVSYEKLNYLHRASARVCVLTTWVHWILWVKKGLGKHGPKTDPVLFNSGVVACVGLTIMFLTSFRFVRQMMYETFLFVHITMCLMFLVGSYFHFKRLSYWAWAALVVWGFDRGVGFLRMFLVNKGWFLCVPSKRQETSACTCELLEGEVVRLTVRRPLLRFSPGQHAFITMPGVALARYEQHPFTIANIPNPRGDVVFLVKGQTGFTRRLIDRLEKDVDDQMNCYLEGPYGTPRDLNHYGSCVLIAGGTGITYSTSHLMEIVRQSKLGNSAVARVRVIWNVRHHDYVSWIAPLLNECFAEGSGSVDVKVNLYVTRSHASDEPNADEVPPHPHPETIVDDTPNDSPMDTPLDSPLDSPRDSSDKSLNEKGASRGAPGAFSDSSSYDEKQSASLGLSLNASKHVRFHRGRSNIEMILREEIEHTPRDAAGLAVGVCGPTGLSLDTRRAVTSVNTAKAVFNGQAEITLFQETFGW